MEDKISLEDSEKENAEYLEKIKKKHAAEIEEYSNNYVKQWYKENQEKF